MGESVEGIGSRKWSFIREGGELWLMQGKTKLATLTADGEQVLHLLATAPQLWEAANELLKNAKAIHARDEETAAAIVDRLCNMVAKAVGKDDWGKVLQS